MLRDIGRIIKNLIGDFYQPLYLSKRFLKLVSRRPGYNSSDEEDEFIEEAASKSSSVIIRANQMLRLM